MSKLTNRCPNVLLLYSDQHNAKVLGCYDNWEVYTPNIDKLASEGVMFTNAYTQNPICTPSRMCIMSGQYTHNHGYYGLMGRKPENLPHIFSYLKKYGYTTGMAGKIHTPAGWLSEYCDYVADGYGYEIPLTFWSERIEEGLQGLRNNEYTLYLYEKGLGDDRDDKVLHEWYEKHGYDAGQGLDARPSRLKKEDTIEGWTAAKTIDFIEKAHKENKPFCFWMTVPRPHQTYAPAKEFWDMYDEEKLKLPPNAEYDMSERHWSAKVTRNEFQNNLSWVVFEPKDWDSARRRVMHAYYACVTQVDYAVGEVLKKLGELGIRENTIVVYASDHGEFAGEHGMIEKAPGIGFRCVTRIPYIWSWPGHLPEGEMRDALVESVDFLPTVCRLAGIPMPNWVDGKDMYNVLYDNEDIRDIAVTENPLTKTINTKKYKFTQYLPEMCEGKDFGELYDIENDPWEIRNLYFDPEYKEIVQEMRYKLYCWMVRTSRFVTVNAKAPDTQFTNQWHKAWELTKEFYDEDKKLGMKFIQKLIDKGWINYL